MEISCPIPNCTKPISKRGIACVHHWAMVPRNRKVKVFKAKPEDRPSAIHHALSVIPEWEG